jgi:hypothetical protein
MISFTILSKESKASTTTKKSKEDVPSKDVSEKEDTPSSDTTSTPKVTKKLKHKRKKKKKRKLVVKAQTKDEILANFNITPESINQIIYNS